MRLRKRHQRLRKRLWRDDELVGVKESVTAAQAVHPPRPTASPDPCRVVPGIKAATLQRLFGDEVDLAQLAFAGAAGERREEAVRVNDKHEVPPPAREQRQTPRYARNAIRHIVSNGWSNRRAGADRGIRFAPPFAGAKRLRNYPMQKARVYASLPSLSGVRSCSRRIVSELSAMPA